MYLIIKQIVPLKRKGDVNLITIDKRGDGTFLINVAMTLKNYE